MRAGRPRPPPDPGGQKWGGHPPNPKQRATGIKSTPTSAALAESGIAAVPRTTNPRRGGTEPAANTGRRHGIARSNDIIINKPVQTAD